MVSTRKRAMAPGIPSSPKRRSTRATGEKKDEGAEPAGGYERFREERIRENLERMQKLGIIDLSLLLKNNKSAKAMASSSPPHGAARRGPSASLLKTPDKSSVLPTRRSSRLHNVTPVCYSENHVEKGKNSVRRSSVMDEEGQKEEVYTKEHDKLLGTCAISWTLFEDGYGKDGKRIYDQIKGKTCHQCRQKTLGHRTHCSKCNLVQGQFCGDCLYMRYGENVLEVKKNPNWICPVCRGICNCSLCRVKKGWAPTGPLYKKVLELGYKSVAHYLIQTRQSQANSENINLVKEESSKNSCFLTDTEDPSQLQRSHVSQTASQAASCNKNIHEGNGNNGPQNVDEQAANDDVSESTVGRHKRKSTKAKDSTALKANPDCIAGRLRKRPNKS